MSASEPLPRLPYVLLGAMTVASFGGPFVILVVVRGGQAPAGRPTGRSNGSRSPLVFGLVIVLFCACVSIGWWYRPAAPGQEAWLRRSPIVIIRLEIAVITTKNRSE